MSDMLEHGASGGAGPLPPSESHDEFLELCATATTGSLSAEERGRLQEHLAQCESCRAIMGQYQAILDRVIPAWVADPAEEKGASLGWSEEEAEKRLFARLGESESFSMRQKPRESRPKTPAPPPVRVSSEDGLWRHMWVQFAAALLLVASLGLIAYRTGIRRGLDLAPHALKPASAVPPVQQAGNSSPASALQTRLADPQVAALHFQLEASLAEITRLKTELAKTQNDRDSKDRDRVRLAQEHSDLSQQLELAKTNLVSVQQQLNSLTEQSAQQSSRAEALQEKVDQLTASTHESDQEIARERELLDHDRDIRDLMGSRDLYIAEVYDVAKTGDTEKPFGRVFYTKGKSLIFYAYDLDQQPGIERARTFQAWGRPGAGSRACRQSRHPL